MIKTKLLFGTLISIIAGVLIAGLVMAWTNPTANPPSGGGALYYYNGNVGIATTNPNEKLTIEGGISVKELDAAPSETSGYGKIYVIGGGGGIDSYTKLLLHANQAESNFVDSSYRNNIITANGNATQSATQSKFGGKSAYFDGTGDYLSVPDSTDWDLGAGDFTIDYWTRFNSVGYAAAVGTSNGAAGIPGWILYFQSATSISFLATTGSYSWNLLSLSSIQYPGGFQINTWYHIAAVRSSGVITLYVNGNAIGSTNNSNTLDSSGTLYIGWLPSECYLNGYLDELRISKGIARWTSNFTPPTSAYSKTSLFFKTSSGEEIEL